METGAIQLRNRSGRRKIIAIELENALYGGDFSPQPAIHGRLAEGLSTATGKPPKKGRLRREIAAVQKQPPVHAPRRSPTQMSMRHAASVRHKATSLNCDDGVRSGRHAS